MRKLTILFTLLTLSAGLAQAECVFTYTATEKLETQFNKFGTPTSHDFSNGAGTVTFSSDVTEIGTQAFASCTALQSITLPASVTTIGTQAFASCNALQSINLSNVTTIRANAFKQCQNLQSFNLSNVTKIEIGAFAQCTALQSITLPASVTTIENSAFNGCRSLTEVTVAWTEADKIPAIDADVFLGIANNKGLSGATLHVPARTKSLYEAKGMWNTFGTIAEIKANLTIEDFNIEIPDYNIYNGDPYTATVTLKEGIIGAGEITVTYKQGETVVASPINVGDYDIYMSVTEGTDCYAFPETQIDTLAIWQASCNRSDFTFTAPENLEYDGNPKVATVVFDDKGGKRTGYGEITVKYNGSTEPPINPGDYTISIDIAEGLNYVAGFNITDDDWTFTIPLDKYKAAAIAAINEAIKDLTLFQKEQEYIENQIAHIQIEESVEAVNSTKNATLAFIALHGDKLAAIEVVKHDMGDYAESEAIYNLIGGLAIEAATNADKITEAKNAAIAKLEEVSVVLGDAATAGYNKGKEDAKTELLGDMATPCTDCTVVEVTNGTTTVTLYNPTNVGYIKK